MIFKYKANLNFMKKQAGLLFVFWVLLCFASCERDDVPVVIPEEIKNIRITDVSDTTIVNTKDIEIGNGIDDILFEKTSTVLTPNGKTDEITLDCCGLGAVALGAENEDAIPMVDTSRSVENVTLINRATITVHTKDLVKCYGHLIRTPENQDRHYYYIRVLVMYAGKNSTVINEGTINVYFDHDPSNTSTIYTIALTADDGSAIVNKGDIHFYGNGSVATRLRGVATFGDNISALNSGTMTAEVDLTEDARMITTGGTRSNVINDGIMRMRLAGNVYCLTRYGDSNLINNNTIDITAIDKPEGYPTGEQVACAMYQPLAPTITAMSSLINRGTVNINVEASKSSTQGFGMFFDMMSSMNLDVNIINEGMINLSRSASVAPGNVAEACFTVRENTTKAWNVNMGRWQTKLRDFGQTHDLFKVKGVNMNFSGGQLLLVKGDDYVDGTSYGVEPEALMYNSAEGFRFEYSGYDNMIIKAADNNVTLTRDKENKQVSLSSK